MLNDQLYKFYNLDFRILITSHENDLFSVLSFKSLPFQVNHSWFYTRPLPVSVAGHVL